MRRCRPPASALNFGPIYRHVTGGGNLGLKGLYSKRKAFSSIPAAVAWQIQGKADMKSLTGVILAALVLLLTITLPSHAGSPRGFGGSSARGGQPSHAGSGRGFVGPHGHGAHPGWSGSPSGSGLRPGWGAHPGWGGRPWWGWRGRPWWGWAPGTVWGAGFYWGWPGVWGGWYPPYYYADPPVITQQTPVYVEPTPPAQQYWYYCENSQAYYPYVQECPGGWIQVIPQPAPPDR